MATFNTAFGSLPSPKTQLFGNRATGGTGAQASRATGQIEQMEAPGTVGGAETFAQLQQQGRARPAPPMMAAPVQQPDMLTALSAQLGQTEPVTPSTMFQPSLAPQLMVPSQPRPAGRDPFEGISGISKPGQSGNAPVEEAVGGPVSGGGTTGGGTTGGGTTGGGTTGGGMGGPVSGGGTTGGFAAPQAMPSILSVLGSRLRSAEDVEEEQGKGGPVTTGGTTDAGAGGATGVPPVTTAPAAPPMGYSPTGGITGTPTIDRTTNTATYTNVEVPVANAPRFTPGQVPPPTAPNGSTFVANTGVTWTKRGGVWTVEGQNVRGYAALTPPELLAQSQANLPAGASAGTFTMGGQQQGVDQFLRQYGTPSTEAEFAALASQAGVTVDALKNYIASAKGNLRFDTKQDIEARAEEQAWKAKNNVGNLPYNYAYVPASQGGPGIRKLSFDEVVARGYQPYGGRALYNNPANDVALARGQGYANLLDAFEIGRTQKIGTTPTPTTPPTTPPTTISFAPNDPNGPWTTDKDNWVEIEPGTWQPRGPEANRWSFINGRWTLKSLSDPTIGGSTPPAPTTPTAPIPRGTTPPTSGGTPPTSGGTPPTGGGTPATPGGLGTGGPAGGALPRTPVIPPFYTPPTGPQGALPSYSALTDAAKDLRTRLLAQLELLTGPSQIQGQAYDALRQAKAADLAAQYGAERSKLEEELARRGISASTIGGGRYGDLAGQQARAIAGFEAELLQQQAEADLRRQQMYLTGMGDLTKVESDIALRAAQLQQEAALRGRELDLQSARDMATAEYQRSQVGLGYAEMGSRETIAANQLAEQNRSALVMEKIRGGELTLAQGAQVMQLVKEMWAGQILPEAFDIILRSLGLDPTKYAGLKPPAKPNEDNKDTAPPTTTTPPTGPTGPTGPTQTGTTGNRPGEGTSGESTPISITRLSGDLRRYPNGQRFNYYGVLLTLQNGVLRDDSGRPYLLEE